MPKLIDVRYVRDYVLYVAFDDGASGEVNLAGELEGEGFEPLQDVEYFRRVRIDPSVYMAKAVIATYFIPKWTD